MKKIDWDTAPNDATHYRDNYFYKFHNDQLWFWSRLFDGWCLSCVHECYYDTFIERPKENINMFGKKDLKTGMILEFGSGSRAMVLLGTENGDIFSGSTTWGNLNELLEDLTFRDAGSVVKVYQPKSNMSFLREGVVISDYNHSLVWERKSEKDLEKEETIKQIKETEEALKKLRNKLEEY